jgi:hypothetical protein
VLNFFRWILNILKYHGEKLKTMKNRSIFLNLNKQISKHFKGLNNIIQENLYTIKFINDTNALKNDLSDDLSAMSTRID